MIPKEFPSPEELQRVICEDEFYRIYQGEFADHKGLTERGKFRLAEFFSNNTTKAKILDIALHIAPIAVDAGTDFLFGEPVKIAVDAENNEKAQKLVTD